MMLNSNHQRNEIPTVSVIIPTYNHAKYLSGALQSVINQSFTNWEAVIINNYSDDDTVEIVTKFNEPRFTLFNFRNEGVIAASRNEGLRHAKAPIIAFLDSDDIWYTDKLNRCLQEFENGADIVCHGENWVSTDSAPRATFYGPVNRASHKNLLFRGNCISTSATLLRKDLLNQLGGFDEDQTFVTAEDYELWMRLSLSNSKIVFVNQLLGEYRRHDQNASGSVTRHLAAEIAVINVHIKFESTSLFNKFRARHRRAKAIYSAGRTEMRGGRNGLAILFFWKAILQSPFFLRTYVATIFAMRNYLLGKSK